MAEYTNGDIFGDSALFDEFDDENVPDKHVKVQPLNRQDDEEEVAAYEMLKEKLTKLEQETHNRLKILLRNLIPPRGLHVQNTESGPVAHVLFMNTDITRKYRQEVEEFFEKLVAKGELPNTQPGMIDIDDDDDDDSVLVKPQRSSRVIIDEDNEIRKEAYLSTGNVQYYQVFCIDQLGRPLVNSDAQLTGWHIPTYTTDFEALPHDENPQGTKKASRPKNVCWNCDAEDHSLRECTAPRDMAKISANKKLFMSTSTPKQERYVKDARQRESNNDRFNKFVPGTISDELRQAIGIRDDQLPPYIYMMRKIGYPPGWINEAMVETSGMRVYNIKRNEDGDIEESEDQKDDKPKYDPTKLVDYPGFNVAPPNGIKDEWREFGAIPMQSEHRKELLEAYMTPPDKNQAKGKKRRGSFMNSKETKKPKTERNEVDMELESSSTGEEQSRGWFGEVQNISGVFKPPLPPTPGTGSPLPPLPSSTSPDTDSDYTPMPSPGSTGPLGSSAAASQESSRSSSPTVEELERQQQQLMEALMDAGTTTTSDTDGAGNSADDEDTQKIDDFDLEPPGVSSSASVDSGNILESPESPNPEGETPTNTQEMRTKTNADTKKPDLYFKISNPPELHKDLSGDSTPNKSGVPRLNKFASGITPHVVESLSEATGVFQKIMGLFKHKGSKSK